MRTFKSKINNTLIYPIFEPYSKNETIFFDIETTGLSAKTSYVYLIGCMYYDNDSFYLIQWFLEDPKNEADLLKALSNKLKSYKRIIHYNGSSFDIPFLITKYKKYNIKQPFSFLDSFDLYKKLLPYRKLLPFPNLKLQTLQKHLGYKRTDKNSGGDLIDLYSQYLGRLKYEKLRYKNKKVLNHNYSIYENSHLDNFNNTPNIEPIENPTSKELVDILLLHNYDDIVGFLDASAILTYVDFLDSEISYEDIININTETRQGHLYLDIEVNKFYPYEIKWTIPFNGSKQNLYNDTTNAPYNANEKYVIFLKNNNISVIAPMISDKLKYFFKNYREYYYLPDEDMAIHKSVSRYVDKEYKTKASPSNCYTYLEGIFVPVFNLDIIGGNKIKEFKFYYNSTTSFAELDTIINSKENIVLWLNSLLSYTKNNKNLVLHE